MQAGQLRHRVTIQKFTVACDTAGEGTKTWTTHATVWASVRPIRGREFFEAQKMSSEVTAKITTRYISGVLPSWRFLHGTKIYTIQEMIDVDDRHRMLEFMVKEQPQTAT
jgi:SPP1 family predicted phage head-tail adaptor